MTPREVRVRRALVGLGLTLGMAAPATAADPGPSRVPTIYHKSRSFRIPFNMNPADRARSRELQLWVSEDGGHTWKAKGTTTPDHPSFPFQAPRDGEYWLAVRTRDSQGKLYPGDGTKIVPNVKVVVDTTPPALTLLPEPRSASLASVRWEVRDDDPDVESLILAYQVEGQTQWRQVPAPSPGRDGVATWDAGSAAPLKVRALIVDRAGNQTRARVDVPSSYAAAPLLADNASTRPSAPPSPEPSPSTSASRPSEEPPPSAPTAMTGPPPASPPPATEVAPRTPPLLASVAGERHDVEAPEASKAQDPAVAPAAVVDPPKPPAESGAKPEGGPLPPEGDGRLAARSEPSRPTDTPNDPAPPAHGEGAPTRDAPPPPPLEDRAPSAAATRVPEGLAAAEAVKAPADPPAGAAAEPSSALKPRKPEGNADPDVGTTSLTNPGPAPAPPAAPAASRERGGEAPVSGIPTIRVSGPRFPLNYAVDEAGPNGPAVVELWITRDSGRTWNLIGSDPDRVSPFNVALEGEGTFGLSLIARDEKGQGDTPPVGGDQPQMWVEVGPQVGRRGSRPPGFFQRAFRRSADRG